ncbi:MAG: glutamine-hydrolyzing carbamoyl-phosphate synthase small subunit [Lachnospiraceae bacterium]|nr:glutamine-hydrolyzing carbamoyl-phosphate synthase small subunit [Lachnospiraceae bacterium]
MYQGAKRKLVLPDGSEYYGDGFGDSCGNRICELVFNTSPVGYQEIVSDPSYTDQFVVMAYPLIGNYGINPDDFETKTPTIGGLIVRDYNDAPSNFRCTETLGGLLSDHHITGLSGVDTRKLVRIIREQGSMIACIADADTPVKEALRLIKETPIPHDAVSRVSRKEKQIYSVDHAAFHVAAIDFGMKENIVRSFVDRGISVTVFPYDTDADTVLADHPDGLFLSNGPGDPTDVPEAIELVRQLRGKLPIFGICLGHQILSLAYGAKTYKLKFGHRGGNHPVKNLATNRIEITSQNHSYAVDDESLKDTKLSVTHINILDKTVEGVACKEEAAFAVQYHPESAPGPQDSSYLFDAFVENMEMFKK